MFRKDCEGVHLRSGSRRDQYGWVRAVVLGHILPAAGAFGGGDQPDKIARLWPTAVVTQEAIVVSDVGELEGFDSAAAALLGDIEIGAAPDPGESLIIHHSSVRAALAGAGANLADIMFSGASSCRVERPSTPVASVAAGGAELAAAPDGTATGA